MPQKLKAALSDKSKSLEEYYELEGEVDDELPDAEDELVQQLAAQGKHQNLSFFAFTATPKEKTLEMFGTKQPDGHFEPFHVYSMRQAIEEGFILDVLKNYMTYSTSYKIAREIEDNPELPKSEATRAIVRFQSLHPWAVAQKAAVMVEQFRAVTRTAIGGQAKAMVVTASRLHAVRYMKEFKKYIANKGYNDLDVLVAFSGSVVDGETEYTETKMNVTKSGENVRENQLKEAFHTDNFNILIVAEKYQTGFDEPLLHTMFVDKKLKGVKAVQTLSRLNRTMPGKKDTFILDFVNDVEDIEAAFQPFYEQTNLREEINVNLIYDTQSKLRKFNVYNQGDIERVMKLVKQAQKQQNERLLGRISSMFKPIMDRYEEMNKDNQYQFRVTLRNFGKWYDYISQLDRLFDMELLEERIFTGYLLKFLPKETRENIDISDKVKLEYYKLRQDFSGEIHLVNKEGELVNPKSIDAGIKPPDERDSLEEIIHKINERFPNDFDEGDRVLVEILYRSFANNPDLKVVSMAKNNDAQMFEKSLFPDVFKDKVMEQYEKNNAAFEKMFGHDDKYFDLVYTLVARDLYKLLRTK